MNIPEDLLFTGVLSRLPVKSLFRFRYVSKSWLALVDDDTDFAQLHLKTFKNNSDETALFVIEITPRYRGNCVVRCSDTFKLVSKMPIKLPDHVVSSLHGLVVTRIETNNFGEFSQLQVLNPSIRNALLAPTLLKSEVSPSSLLMDEDIGLGYDQVAKSYKLVKLIFADIYTLHSVAIHTLGDDSWKIIDFQGKGFNWNLDGPEFHKAVCFQSSMYFIARDARKDSWDLVRYDLNKEVFSSASLPEDPYFNCNWRRLTRAGGGFAMEVFDIYSSTIYMWAVDLESMCWTKPLLYTWEDGCRFHFKKNGKMLTWRNSWDDEANEIGRRELVWWDVLGSYNLERKEHTVLQHRLDSFVRHVFCHVESLILHKMKSVLRA